MIERPCCSQTSSLSHSGSRGPHISHRTDENGFISNYSSRNVYFLVIKNSTFFCKKMYFFLPKKCTFFCKKKYFFCKKKYLFLVIKTHFMPSNALLWEPQSHHQGRLSGLLSSPIKQMTPQTTRVPSPPSQWKKSTLPLLHLQKKVHWLIWIS